MHQSDDPSRPTITLQEAAEESARYAQEISKALGPDVKLEMKNQSHGPCSNPSGVGYEKREKVDTVYWIHGIDPTAHNAKFDEVKSWLKSNGWTIGSDERPDDMFINAGNEQSHFTMSLLANKKGQLSLSTGSPCVWPSGTPQP